MRHPFTFDRFGRESMRTRWKRCLSALILTDTFRRRPHAFAALRSNRLLCQRTAKAWHPPLSVYFHIAKELFVEPGQFRQHCLVLRHFQWLVAMRALFPVLLRSETPMARIAHLRFRCLPTVIRAVRPVRRPFVVDRAATLCVSSKHVAPFVCRVEFDLV